jgi:tetratricopeptide (TPR) repeat protein
MPTRSSDLVDFDAQWDFDDPAATEKKFRELLPAAVDSGNESYHLQLLTQIARTLALQRRFDDAHATLDEVESRLTPDLSLVRVRYLLERGRTLNSSKRKDEARPLFLEAWDLAKSIGEDGYAVDAAHMMGIIEPAEEALEWNRQAVALAESSTNERARRWRGSLYNNIGWTVFGQENYEEALGWFEKALVARQEEEKPGDVRIAKWCIAKTLRVLGRVEEALKMQQALLREHEAEGGRDGYVYEELAECHLALDQPGKSREYFALAWEELSEDAWLVDTEPERIARLKELGAATD